MARRMCVPSTLKSLEPTNEYEAARTTHPWPEPRPRRALPATRPLTAVSRPAPEQRQVACRRQTSSRQGRALVSSELPLRPETADPHAAAAPGDVVTPSRNLALPDDTGLAGAADDGPAPRDHWLVRDPVRTRLPGGAGRVAGGSAQRAARQLLHHRRLHADVAGHGVPVRLGLPRASAHGALRARRVRGDVGPGALRSLELGCRRLGDPRGSADRLGARLAPPGGAVRTPGAGAGPVLTVLFQPTDAARHHLAVGSDHLDPAHGIGRRRDTAPRAVPADRAAAQRPRCGHLARRGAALASRRRSSSFRTWWS